MSGFFSAILDGTLIFRGVSNTTAAAILLALVVILAIAWFAQVGRAKPWVRRVGLTLRLLAVALLVLLLMEPVVRSEELVPQQSYLLHLFDVSESMSIPDYNGVARIAAMANAAAPGARAAEGIDGLYRRIDLSFDDSLVPMTPAFDWQTGADSTNLAGALRAARAKMSGLPVAGLVLYTDGNPTGAGVEDVMDAAHDLGVPVYTVGVGPEVAPRDVWVESVLHPKEAAAGARTPVTVLVGTRGMRGRAIRATIFEGDREIATQQVRPTSDEQVLRVNIDLETSTGASAFYRCTLETTVEEIYTWNNSWEFFMDVSTGTRRVLYVEGSPRYEYRFLRAAFSDDERFEVTSLIYVTDDGDTYRQGIHDRNELARGFPSSEEELFQYDVVVIGDISASRFSRESLAALREFVRKRGGGLLFLGGEESFARGGFGRTPLAEILPFDIDSVRPPTRGAEHRVVPAREGLERSMFGAYDPQQRGPAPWEDLPMLSGLYALNGLKPGAIALCEIDQPGENPPVVAYQRYGRGVSLVCGISATWPWKFQTEADDPRYSAFWKEMILVLTDGRPDRLELEASPMQAKLGDVVSLRGAVLTTEFALDPAARVRLEITKPDGTTTEVAARPESAEGLTFSYPFEADGPGLYAVRARSGDELEAQTFVYINADSAEYREVRLNTALLTRVAESTGGAYVHLSDLESLPDRITPMEGALRVPHDDSLWDRSIFFWVILAALLSEWFVRRLGGLA